MPLIGDGMTFLAVREMAKNQKWVCVKKDQSDSWNLLAEWKTSPVPNWGLSHKCLPYTRRQSQWYSRNGQVLKGQLFCLASYSISRLRGSAWRATSTVFLGTSEIKTIRSLSIRRYGKRLFPFQECCLMNWYCIREGITERRLPIDFPLFCPPALTLSQSSDMCLHPLLKPLSIVRMLGCVWETGGSCELPNWVKSIIRSSIHTCCGWLHVTKPVCGVASVSWESMCPKLFIVIVGKLTGGICSSGCNCGSRVCTIIWCRSPAIGVQLGIATGVRKTRRRASIKPCRSRITVLCVQHRSGCWPVVMSSDIVISIGWILGKKRSMINGRQWWRWKNDHRIRKKKETLVESVLTYEERIDF